MIRNWVSGLSKREKCVRCLHSPLHQCTPLPCSLLYLNVTPQPAGIVLIFVSRSGSRSKCLTLDLPTHPLHPETHLCFTRKDFGFPMEAPLTAPAGSASIRGATTKHFPKHFNEVCLTVLNFQPPSENCLSSSCQFWQHDFFQILTICSLKPPWCWLHQSRVTHLGWYSYCFPRETHSRLNFQITSPKRDAARREAQGMAVLFPDFHRSITWIGFIKQRNSRAMWEESRDHHPAHLWNYRPNVTSSEWQPPTSLRERCQGWWDLIKLTYCIFSCLPINLQRSPLFHSTFIYAALVTDRTLKKKSELTLKIPAPCSEIPWYLFQMGKERHSSLSLKRATSSEVKGTAFRLLIKSSTRLKMAKPTEMEENFQRENGNINY